MPGYAISVPIAPGSVSRPLWDALRRAEQPMTIGQLHRAIAAHPDAISLRLARWRRAGLVTTTPERPRRFLMSNTVAATREPPFVNKAASVTLRTIPQRQRLWSAIRILKRFDLPGLMIAAQATRRSAEDMINVLCRAGYLRRLTRGNGMTGEWGQYQLQRQSGPKAPVIRQVIVDGKRKRLLTDPNLGVSIDISPSAVSLRPAKKGVNHVR